MVSVQVFNNGNVQELYFNELLDGLVYLERQYQEFDYIIIDDDRKVYFDALSSYIDSVNEFCKKVYGYYYDR